MVRDKRLFLRTFCAANTRYARSETRETSFNINACLAGDTEQDGAIRGETTRVEAIFNLLENFDDLQFVSVAYKVKLINYYCDVTF